MSGTTSTNKTLDKRITEYAESDNPEDKQLYDWLVELKQYRAKNAPMEIQCGRLSGQMECPNCKRPMKIGITRGYCNLCGQAVKMPHHE